MKFLLLSTLLAVLGPLRAASVVPAITSFTNGGPEANAYYNIAGFDFTNSATLSITALGVEICCSSQTTLNDSHFVGIYDLAGDALQVEATVAAGSSGDAEGFAYANLSTPFTLTAGTWFIGVQYNQNSNDLKYAQNGSIQMAPNLTFDATDGFFSNSSVSTTDPASASIHFTQPFTGPGGRDSYIGPNFQILTTPEPATIYLISISLGLAALLRRKRP